MASIGNTQEVPNKSSKKEQSIGFTFSNSFAYDGNHNLLDYSYSAAPVYEISLTKHFSLLAVAQSSFYKSFYDADRTPYQTIRQNQFINPSMRYYFFKSRFLFTDLSYAYGKSTVSTNTYSGSSILNAVGIGFGLQGRIPSSLKLGFLTGRIGLEFYFKHNFSLNNTSLRETNMDGDSRIGIKYYFGKKK